MADPRYGHKPRHRADRSAVVVLARRRQRSHARRRGILRSAHRARPSTACRRLVGVRRRHRLRLDRPRPGIPSSERCAARVSDRHLWTLQRLHGGGRPAIPRHVFGQRRAVAHAWGQDQALLAALLRLPGAARGDRSAVKAVAEPRRLRVVAGTSERRWRLAALLGLAVMLALASYALVVLGPGADANQMVSVLRAAKSIHAGTSITSDELTTARLRTQDPSVLATLLRDSDRSRVLGQVAAVDVNAGDLVPADVVASQFTAGLWDVAVPVRRMPATLAPGDHVALLVTTTLAKGSQGDLVYMQDVQVLGIGQGSGDLWAPATVAPPISGARVALLLPTTLANGSQVDLVYMQDVQVLGIGQGSVDLWVPAKLAPQVEWYADHGGIALIKMQPGGVQDKIPAGGAS